MHSLARDNSTQLICEQKDYSLPSVCLYRPKLEVLRSACPEVSNFDNNNDNGYLYSADLSSHKLLKALL